MSLRRIGVVADRQQVGADRAVPAVDDGVAADPGAHQAQIGVVDRRAGERHHRRRAHQGLHDPEAEIGKAPDRDRLRLEAGRSAATWRRWRCAVSATNDPAAKATLRA